MSGVYIATAENALGSYNVDAVGRTDVEAVAVCKAVVRKERRRLGYPPYEYMDDVQVVGPLRVGRAYLDMSRAGEVKQ